MNQAEVSGTRKTQTNDHKHNGGGKSVADGVMEDSKEKILDATEHAKSWVADATSRAGERLTDTVKGASDYFSKHSPREVSKDVYNMFRENPVSGILLGIGLGIAIDRLVRRPSAPEATSAQ